MQLSRIRPLDYHALEVFEFQHHEHHPVEPCQSTVFSAPTTTFVSPDSAADHGSMESSIPRPPPPPPPIQRTPLRGTLAAALLVNRKKKDHIQPSSVGLTLNHTSHLRKPLSNRSSCSSFRSPSRPGSPPSFRSPSCPSTRTLSSHTSVLASNALLFICSRRANSYLNFTGRSEYISLLKDFPVLVNANAGSSA